MTTTSTMTNALSQIITSLQLAQDIMNTPTTGATPSSTGSSIMLPSAGGTSGTVASIFYSSGQSVSSENVKAFNTYYTFNSSFQTQVSDIITQLRQAQTSISNINVDWSRISNQMSQAYSTVSDLITKVQNMSSIFGPAAYTTTITTIITNLMTNVVGTATMSSSSATTVLPNLVIAKESILDFSQILIPYVEAQTVGGLGSQIGNIQSGVAGLNTSIAGVQSGVTGLKTSITGAQSGIDGLNTSMQNIRSDMQTGMTALDSSISGVQSGVTGLHGSMQDMRSGMQAGISTLFSNDNEQTQALADIRAKEAAQAQALTGLNSQLSTMQTQLSTAQTQLSDTKTQLQAATDLASQHQNNANMWMYITIGVGVVGAIFAVLAFMPKSSEPAPRVVVVSQDKNTKKK